MLCQEYKNDNEGEIFELNENDEKIEEKESKQYIPSKSNEK